MDIKNPLLIIDSGLGGLSVWQAIRERLPNLSSVYIADHQFFPYGAKKEQEVVARVKKLVAKTLPVYQPLAVVVACNTASTLVLPVLREAFDIPIVGVVPAIKTAAELTAGKVIGLLATPGTVNRAYTDSLVNEFAGDISVVKVGSIDLVVWAEDSIMGRLPNAEDLQRIVRPILAAGADQIVLGCTHFPLLRKSFESLAPNVNWIDSGNAIARRVEQVLNERNDAVVIDAPNVVQLMLYTGVERQSDWVDAIHKLGMDKIENWSET